MHSQTSSIGKEQLLLELDRHIAESFSPHPFELKVDRNNFESAIAEYLTMSIAFPYLQAGAIFENYRRGTQLREHTNANVEITAAIASFIVWDEFGGHGVIRSHDNALTPFVRKPNASIHSKLLSRDIETLLGKLIAPTCGKATAEYLNNLYEGLSDAKQNRNVAYMIAFEKHAQSMIESLWNAINRIFCIPKDTRLSYFYSHIGCSSPAEEAHVKVTQDMLDELIPPQSHKQFLQTCVDAYSTNVKWCEAIVSPTFQK